MWAIHFIYENTFRLGFTLDIIVYDIIKYTNLFTSIVLSKCVVIAVTHARHTSLKCNRHLKLFNFI